MITGPKYWRLDQPDTGRNGRFDRGTPTAVANTTNWMNVFAQNTGKQIVNYYWTNTGGWASQVSARIRATPPAHRSR